jgi:4-amino-4-deoxy-L-arabinose transferase-like glycosyltransferase
LTAAANLSDGRGLLTIAWEGDVVPLRHFPPAYPALLASGRSLGLASEATARGLNVALMVATIVVAFVVARRLIPKSPWPAVTVATLFATAHDLVVAHSMAWTEPLYLTLTLLGCLLLARALERASLRLLLSTSALVGVTATVRYVGVANLAALGLAVVIWWPREWWRRVRTAAVAFTGAPWLPSLSRCVCSTARAKAEPNQHAGAQA